MKKYSLSSALLPSTVMVFTCAAIHTARAADDLWSVTGPASWTVGTNWSLGTPPAAADRAIIANGGSASLASGDAITIDRFRLVNGSLVMTGGSLATTTTVDGDSLKIGDYAYNLAGGTVALTMSGASAITAADRIYIADGEGTGVTTVVTNVTATLSDTASLTATNDYVILGRQNGTANVTLNNSAVIEKKGTTNTFIIGDGVRGTGNVTLNDSSALKSANQFVIGNAGTGNVTLKSTSSVLASSGTVTIGNGANSIGTVALEGASTFTLSTGTCVLGNANTAQGTVTLTGTSAFNVLANEMYVGNASGGTGSITISDNATLTKGATGFAFTIGRANGTGTVTVQNSGKLVSQNSLRMTEGATANATLNVKDSGTVQVTGAMQIGYQGTGLLDVTSNTATVTVGGELSVASSAGKGTLRMTGGTLNATTPNTYVIGGGNGAQATVTLSGTSALNGGNMKWKAGDYGGGTPTGSTNVTLSDSAALTLREFTIGHIGGPTATANVTLLGTSTLTVNNFVTLGRDDAGTNGGMSAALNLNGGTLATKSIRSGGSASAGLNTVNGNGGTIKALATEPDFFQPTSNNSTRPSVALGSSGLSFDTNSFTVGIKNSLTGTGGLTKTGAGKLIFFSPQAFTGTTAVNQGTLELDTAGSLAGPLYAASGGTVSISGATGLSATVPDLTLAGGSQLVLPASQFTAPVTATTVLATLGPVTVTVSGTLAVGDYPLIDHSAAGTIQGTGVSAFQLAPLGRGVVASIVDEDGIVKLRVTAVNPLLWTGVNINPLWDINTTANWSLSGVASTYQQNDNLLFNDTANKTGVILNSTVTPSNVRFNNNTKDYTLSGTGAIAGATAGLTKDGSRKLTVTTANTYGGSTAVNGGILQFGDGTTNGSIAGPLAVTGGSVVFNPTGSATYAGSISGFGFDDIGISKIGSGTQIFTGLANTFDGPFAISEGTVKFGNGLINGELGSTTTYNLAGGTTLAIDFATAINFSASNNSPWSKITGSGLVTLNSAQAVNGSANWGQLTLEPGFTGSLSILKGRVETQNPFGLGGTSGLSLADGSQLLLLSSVDPYTTPLQIAGYGWGEGGYNYGALRVAANAGATWGGNITLAANSGIFAQVNGQITVTGTISGAYALQLFAQAQAAEAFPATVTLAPTVQNTYASTTIDGNAGGMVKAGSQYAFSTGPLTANNATLWLNGYSFAFASLTGTSGKIGNYGTTPSVLTVGGDSTSTTYGGVILDGAAGTLGLVKNGTGTLTLTGANTYTGSTTVHAGVLSVSTAFLGDVSAVSIDSGAVLNLTTGVEDTIGTLFLGGVQVPAGTYGPTTPVYGSYFTGTGTLVVTNGPGTGGFGTWAASKGLDGTPGKENGKGDDPDKDGMDNLTEFYLDGNPLASDRSILPVASLSQDHITLTFHRRDDAEASVTTQVAQYGTSLAGWSDTTITAATSTDPNGVIVTVTENDAAADLITVQVPRSLAASGKLFGRIKVEAP